MFSESFWLAFKNYISSRTFALSSNNNFNDKIRSRTSLFSNLAPTAYVYVTEFVKGKTESLPSSTSDSSPAKLIICLRLSSSNSSYLILI